MLRTAWYCQNGCQMHWLARKPEFRCPHCRGEFLEDDSVFLTKHPPIDLGHLAKLSSINPLVRKLRRS